MSRRVGSPNDAVMDSMVAEKVSGVSERPSTGVDSTDAPLIKSQIAN